MISLRRIRRGEGDLFRQLRLAALQESPAAFSSTYASAVRRSRESWHEQADGTAEGGERCTLLAFDGSAPVGMGAVYRTGPGAGEGEVLQVWVAPEARGSGAAAALLEGLLRWCAENGIGRALARVRPGNARALRFYKVHGFEPLETAPEGTLLARAVEPAPEVSPQPLDRPYTHQASELAELRELLIRSYAGRLEPHNWRPAMLENWSYASRYLEPLGYFTDRVHLWRAAGGELAAYLIRYYRMTYLQVLPAQRALEADMLAWAEQHWAGEQGQIATMAYAHDPERLAILAQRGYQDRGLIEYVHLYDLDRPGPEVRLPPGFRIVSLAEHGSLVDRVALENAVWGVTLDEAWLRGKVSAPAYSLDWDLLAVSPEGALAGFSLVWVDWRNRTAEIDPLGTHPDYRGRGLARALVAESFRRMRAHGLTHAYIASEAGDDVVNALYRSFQPCAVYRGHRWSKQVG